MKIFTKEIHENFENVGIRSMGIYLPSNATGLKHWKQAYLDPEYRWTTTNLEITSDRYSFTNVATMLGRHPYQSPRNWRVP